MKRLSFIIIACLGFSGCFGDRGSGCVSNYVFETPLTVTPANGILNIGDTLHVSMITDNTMMIDLLDTGRIVNFAYFDPFLDFLIPSLDTFPVKDGLELHDIIIDEKYEAPIVQGSSLSDWIAFLEIEKGETESRLDFKVALQEKGTFAIIAFPHLYDSDEKSFIDFKDRCGGRCCSGIEASILINGGDNNEQILSAHNKTVEDQYWEKSKGSRGFTTSYYFKVE